MIRLSFACDGAAGHERLGECGEIHVVQFPGYGVGLFRDAVALVQEKGWTFTQFGPRFIVRCPKCEALKVKRNLARQKRDRLREARTR
jgi:hypothetical protein